MLGEPIAILDRRLGHKANRAIVQVLVQWFNMSPSEATWDEYEALMSQFPHLILEEKDYLISVQGGGRGAMSGRSLCTNWGSRVKLGVTSKLKLFVSNC